MYLFCCTIHSLHTDYIAVIGHNLNLVLHTDECHNLYINKHFLFHILQHFFYGQFISTVGASVSAIFQIILHQGYEKATPTTTETKSCSRVLSRFFDRVGHETTYASSEKRAFFSLNNVINRPTNQNIMNRVDQSWAQFWKINYFKNQNCQKHFLLKFGLLVQ